MIYIISSIVNTASNFIPLSIVIPTYGREQVLTDTIENLLSLDAPAEEIIVVDQSQSHLPQVQEKLDHWQNNNQIQILNPSIASIPHAMNLGLLNASHQIVLFLDDDIRADAQLVNSHYQTHLHNPDTIVAGKVIQPWDNIKKLSDDGHQFNSDESKRVNQFMGGNFSLSKKHALELGGFDENFIAVAYRFEKEFAERWQGAGFEIVFQPHAVIDHLKVTSGGTREFGQHLTTVKPHHAVGAYYYLLVSNVVQGKSLHIIKRIISSVMTSHHLKRPWYIPVTLIAELRGLTKAVQLNRSGPKRLTRLSQYSQPRCNE